MSFSPYIPLHRFAITPYRPRVIMALEPVIALPRDTTKTIWRPSKLRLSRKP